MIQVIMFSTCNNNMNRFEVISKLATCVPATGVLETHSYNIVGDPRKYT